ncbi:cnnm4 [Symbiodinium necroappetens]|uniref:Cnnm4 protein n=1 Tax=Symbiodinium necroappetens TaxID=1628268 RepID=A0A812WEM3_9DINO|nr:cnnm4 [Symbiodinium necroappetens]
MAHYSGPELQRRDMINLGASLIITAGMAVASLWWLSSEWDSYGCYSMMSDPLVLCYNSILAVGQVSLLTWHYLDKNPLVVRYHVPGRPEIAPVHRSFLHLQRWSTFTIWSNTVSGAFFVFAALQGWSRSPSALLCTATQITWELLFPLAFFVNIVVTFVLIPGIKKMRDGDKLRRILRLKPQLLHNGMVLSAAVEAWVARPPLLLAHFPVLVLFGSFYVAFAWYFFIQTKVYHYVFMDFRFKHQPIALILLLALLAALYAMGAGALAMALESGTVRLMIFVVALGTCTWRADEIPDDAASSEASTTK